MDCSLPSQPAGASKMIFVLVKTLVAGSVSNSLAISAADTADPNSANNSSAVTVTVATPGSIQLITAATLNRLADGSYQAAVTVKNIGGATAPNVRLTGATLGPAAGSVLPQSLGAIASGASVTTTVTFPASAGAPGAAVVQKYAGTYTGGTLGGSIRAILP
jgi:hypothetical protein